jgi:hypothetical protein
MDKYRIGITLSVLHSDLLPAMMLREPGNDIGASSSCVALRGPGREDPVGGCSGWWLGWRGCRQWLEARPGEDKLMRSLLGEHGEQLEHDSDAKSPSTRWDVRRPHFEGPCSRFSPEEETVARWWLIELWCSMEGGAALGARCRSAKVELLGPATEKKVGR